MKILLLTHSPSTVKIVSGILAKHPEATLVVVREAGEVFAAAPDTSCFLADWDAVGMDVKALLEHLQEANHFFPTIALSEDSSKSRLMETIYAGARHFIRKPFNDHILWSKMQEAMRPTPLTGQDLKSNNVDYLLIKTREATDQEDYQRALALVDRALQIQKTMRVLWKTRGDILSAMGKYADAETSWKQAETLL